MCGPMSDLVICKFRKNKKHGNAMKPGFHGTIALWYLLKLLVSGSWCDECIMIYFKLLVLASWQGFYSPIDHKINPHLRLYTTYPPAKFDVDWSKETQVIVKKNNVWLKTTIFSKLARILQSNWPQKQSPPVSWCDLPTCKVWCWLIKGNLSYHKKKT